MKGRIHSLDTLKGIALFFVVYIHARSFLSTWTVMENFNFVLANLSRFAVPAFFMTSGFLLALKLGEDSGRSFVNGQIRRLGKYYLMASAIYLPLVIGLNGLSSSMSMGSFSNWLEPSLTGIDGLVKFLYIGNAITPFLWFIPALLYSLLLIQRSVERDLFSYLFPAAFLLHLVAISSNIYRIVELPLPLEDAVFFGLLYTSIGFKIGKDELQEKIGRSELQLGLGIFLVVYLLERFYLSNLVNFTELFPWDTWYFWGPYSIMLIPLATGIFIWFLKNPDLGRDTRLNLYGKHTLLGYLIHPLVIGVIAGMAVLLAGQGLDINGTLAWDLVLLPLSYLATMELSVILRKRF